MSQIQMRFDKDSYASENYSESLVVLDSYHPKPAVTMALRMKGNMPDSVLRRIVAIAKEWDLEFQVLVTATWGKGEPEKFRLYGQQVKMELHLAE